MRASEAPAFRRGECHYSDLFAPYRALLYTPGIHISMPDKSETYRVEGDNAELRHYLARLAANRVASPAVSMPCTEPLSWLSLPGTVATFTAIVIHATLLISVIPSVHDVHHSSLPFSLTFPPRPPKLTGI